jgi:XTP/dITP diphosphohydrolase
MTRPGVRVLVFATRNPGKLVELRQLLAGLPLDVRTPDELGRAVPEVIEDGATFAANARKKALAVSRAAGLAALADDSGLEVDALGGAPGVHSARYAGAAADAAANNQKLLAALAAVPDQRRTARFRSVLALADCAGPLGDRTLEAEGVCEGVVLRAPRGTGGFGYDPLFCVPDLDLTFAELDLGDKNGRSHRARAMLAMRPLLMDYFHLAKAKPSG